MRTATGLGLAALAAAISARAGGSEHGVQAVPTLGGPRNYAYAINDAGLVAGEPALNFDPGGDWHAFVWNPADNTLIEIATFGGVGQQRPCD